MAAHGLDDGEGVVASERGAVVLVGINDQVGVVGGTDGTLGGRVAGLVLARRGARDGLEREAARQVLLRVGVGRTRREARENERLGALELDVEGGAARDDVAAVRLLRGPRDLHGDGLLARVDSREGDGRAVGGGQRTLEGEGRIGGDGAVGEVDDVLGEPELALAHVQGLDGRDLGGRDGVVGGVANLVEAAAVLEPHEVGQGAVDVHRVQDARAELPAAQVEARVARGELLDGVIVAALQDGHVAIGVHGHDAGRHVTGRLPAVGARELDGATVLAVGYEIEDDRVGCAVVDAVRPGLVDDNLGGGGGDGVGVLEVRGARALLGTDVSLRRLVIGVGEAVLGPRVVSDLHRAIGEDARGDGVQAGVAHRVAGGGVGVEGVGAVTVVDELRLLLGGQSVIGRPAVLEVGDEVEGLLAGPDVEAHGVRHAVGEPLVAEVPLDRAVLVGGCGGVGPGLAALGVGEPGGGACGGDAGRSELGHLVLDGHILVGDRAGDLVHDLLEGVGERLGVGGVVVGAAELLHDGRVTEGADGVELVAGVHEGVRHVLRGAEVPSVGVRVARAPGAVGLVVVAGPVAVPRVAERGVAV